MDKPTLGFVENYSTHSSKVQYKDLSTDKNYEIQVGLFCSVMQGDLLVSEFGHLVFQK